MSCSVVAAAGTRLYSAGADTRVLNEPTAGSAVMLESTSPARPHDQHGDAHDRMIRIPGGTFRMGSDQHYPEEAPVHRVTVDAFWIDRTPVTNRQFKAFVRATGHVTSAQIVPEAKDYPGALPHMLYAGSLVFIPPERPVDLRNWSEWWTFLKGADWRHPYGPRSNINGRDNHPVVHVTLADALAYAAGPARSCRPKRSGNSPRAAGSTAPTTPGAMSSRPAARTGQHLAGRVSAREPLRRRLRADLTGDRVRAQRLRPARHDRQCLGVDHRLVLARAHRRRAEGVLHPGEPARRRPRTRAMTRAAAASKFRER